MSKRKEETVESLSHTRAPLSLPVLWLIQWDTNTWRSVTTSLPCHVWLKAVHTSIGSLIFLSVSADLCLLVRHGAWVLCVCVHLFRANISSASQPGMQQLFYSSAHNRKSVHTQLNMFKTAVSNCVSPKWSQMSAVASCCLAPHICHRQR